MPTKRLKGDPFKSDKKYQGEFGSKTHKFYQDTIDPSQRTINATDYKKVNQICLKRNDLVKWASHLNFEETVIGCLVQINFDPNLKKYIICKIKDVVEKSTYYSVPYNNDNVKDINKWLVVEVEGEEKEFQIKFVSNMDIDEIRLKHWLDDCNKRQEPP